MQGVAYFLLGGLGGILAWVLASLAYDSRNPRTRQHQDRSAQLETAVTAYRAEVTELADRVDRWFRRVEKREERAKASTEISTDISTAPEGAKVVPSREELRERFLAARRRR